MSRHRIVRSKHETLKEYEALLESAVKVLELLQQSKNSNRFADNLLNSIKECLCKD